MKKWMALALTLILALPLTACGEEKAPVVQEPEPPASQEPVEQVPEPETVELEYFLEGDPMTVTAVRYAGDGFTIDIPEEGWRMETDTEEGYPSVEWEAELNEDVELEIVTLTGMTLEQAQAWVRAEEDDYDLIEDKRGGLGGMDAEDSDVLEARLEAGTDAVYAILLRYPIEAMEGFGTTMGVMADTFTIA